MNERNISEWSSKLCLVYRFKFMTDVFSETMLIFISECIDSAQEFWCGDNSDLNWWICCNET